MIARSWRRSLQQHRLDPDRLDVPMVLSAPALREHVQPMQPLLALAEFSLQRLFAQVREAGYVVLMTDAKGVTVAMLHDASLDAPLRQAGLYPGSTWQEHTEGTCAVALSTLEKVALTVHRGEHFRAANRGLTCSAAPVLAPDGGLLGVIDVSALSSPDDRRSQSLVLELVADAACRVENAYFLDHFATHWVLNVGRHPRLVELGAEALLAVDGDGRVLGANRRFAAYSGTDPQALRGRRIDELLGVDLDRLCAASARDARAPQPIRVASTTKPGYALLLGPRRRPSRPAPAAKAAPPLPPALAELAGGDPTMQAHARHAQRLLDKGVSLLLQGESGTGKEAFAKAVHACSARARGAFVAVNCAAIPESLIESELFGYSAGAFTGAARGGARGRIAQAHGGTLFLDEIGDMPLALQSRLLRVLGEREVQSLGSPHASPFDAQVICATHRDLMQQVERGEFRLDLFYRINGVTLYLPALREREDLDALIDGVLHAEAASLRLPTPTLLPAARRKLLAHEWPGNLRELHNVLRAALVLGDGEPIDAALIATAIRPRPGGSGAPPTPEQVAALPDQAEAVRQALLACRGNVSQAARRLGIGRATLYRYMQRHRITPPGRLLDLG
ncbi:MAG: sigma-54-dependent Fis family transcriptional regulator [Betaproteobacteria bacterium]|nr:sigma-54-dependent Fis family transcriptional regulator [Betaproteobacteria bacterium]